MKSILDLRLEAIVESALEYEILIADKDFVKLKNTQYRWKKSSSCFVLKKNQQLFQSFIEQMNKRCFYDDSEYFFLNKKEEEKFLSPFLRIKVK